MSEKPQKYILRLKRENTWKIVTLPGKMRKGNLLLKLFYKTLDLRNNK